MPYSVKGLFEINEDMVQILLMFEVLFTQDSEVVGLFCGASPSSEPSFLFSNYFLESARGSSLFKVTDEADRSGRAVSCPF